MTIGSRKARKTSKHETISYAHHSTRMSACPYPEKKEAIKIHVSLGLDQASRCDQHGRTDRQRD